MPTPLRVLVLEDQPADAELFLHELRQAGFDPEWQRVETEEEYLAALHPALDIILSDYSLPQFDGLSAVRFLRARGLDLPFILISGTVGEDVAVSAMKEGADDYLLKDRLTRLGPAVKSALEQKRLRDERKLAEAALWETESQLRMVLNNAPITIFATDSHGVFTLSEGKGLEHVGLKPGENVGVSALNLYGSFPFVEYSGKVMAGEDVIRRVLAGEEVTAVTELRGVYFDNHIGPLRGTDGKVVGIVGVAIDITERKQAEETLRRNEALLLQTSKMAKVGGWELDLPTMKLLWSLETYRIYEADPSFQPDLENAINFYAPEARPIINEAVRRASEEGAPYDLELPFITAKGRHIWVRAIGQPEFRDGKCVRLFGAFQDITERKQVEEQTQRQLQRLAALHTIDQAIAGSMDVNFVFKVILDHVISQLAVDAAVILLYNPATQALEYTTGRGFRTESLQHLILPLGESYAGRAALMHQKVYIPDLQERKTDFLRSPEFSQEGFVSYYGIPLIAKGEIKGMLEVFHRAAFEAETEWLNFLETLAGQTAIAIDNAALFKGLQLSNIELTMAYDATIEGWSRAMDLRDKETEGHTQRVTEMSQRLARAMRIKEAELVNMRWGALLHDIGKMGVSDGILHKPGPLTDEEWVAMKKHPTFAYEMLAPISYLQAALDIPYCHHEKWDGSGYPRGLKGEEIPLAARIFAVVDVWDALTSDRPYRPAWTKEKVREYIRSSSGTHFDPQVVDVFMQIPN